MAWSLYGLHSSRGRRGNFQYRVAAQDGMPTLISASRLRESTGQRYSKSHRSCRSPEDRAVLVRQESPSPRYPDHRRTANDFRDVWTVLIDRVEDVVVAFILRIKARLSVCRYRCGKEEHWKESRRFGIHRALIPTLQGWWWRPLPRRGVGIWSARGRPLPEPSRGSMSRVRNMR